MNVTVVDPAGRSYRLLHSFFFAFNLILNAY